MARKLLHNKEEWERQVGRFILAFGDIEHCTIALLGAMPECRIPSSAPQIPLATRLALLLEICARSQGAEFAALKALLDEVQSLASRRNLIAHNTVWFSMRMSDEGTVLLEGVMRSTRNARINLDIDALTALADQVDNLSTRLGDVAVPLMQSLHPDIEPA